LSEVEAVLGRPVGAAAAREADSSTNVTLPAAGERFAAEIEGSPTAKEAFLRGAKPRALAA
jgi:hypothetical protein